jgi:hypothetical protein
MKRMNPITLIWNPAIGEAPELTSRMDDPAGHHVPSNSPADTAAVANVLHVVEPAAFITERIVAAFVVPCPFIRGGNELDPPSTFNATRCAAATEEFVEQIHCASVTNQSSYGGTVRVALVAANAVEAPLEVVTGPNDQSNDFAP